MSVAADIGRKAIRVASSAVDFAVLCVVLFLVAFGCYALWDTNQVYDAADRAQYAVYKPTVEDGGQSFGELQALNPEVFSWLTVYGTNIDYPVVQGPDNMKYVNTDAKGGYSLSGSIFLDCDNARDYSDFNSILYGHRMEKQAMFGELGSFSEKGYFDARRYGNLHFGGKDFGLEFFAFLQVDAYDATVFAPGIQGEESQQRYLEELLSKAMQTRAGSVGADDRIILLSTCSAGSTNGRDLLVGRITDEVYEDGFGNDEDSAKTGAGIDGQGFFAGIPGAAWLLLLVLAAIVFALVLSMRKRTGCKHKEADSDNV